MNRGAGEAFGNDHFVNGRGGINHSWWYLLEIHTLPRAIRPRDKGDATAISNVGVVWNETLNCKLLVLTTRAGARMEEGVVDAKVKRTPFCPSKLPHPLVKPGPTPER